MGRIRALFLLISIIGSTTILQHSRVEATPYRTSTPPSYDSSEEISRNQAELPRTQTKRSPIKDPSAERMPNEIIDLPTSLAKTSSTEDASNEGMDVSKRQATTIKEATEEGFQDRISSSNKDRHLENNVMKIAYALGCDPGTSMEAISSAQKTHEKLYNTVSRSNLRDSRFDRDKRSLLDDDLSEEEPTAEPTLPPCDPDQLKKILKLITPPTEKPTTTTTESPKPTVKPTLPPGCDPETLTQIVPAGKKGHKKKYISAARSLFSEEGPTAATTLDPCNPDKLQGETKEEPVTEITEKNVKEEPATESTIKNKEEEPVTETMRPDTEIEPVSEVPGGGLLEKPDPKPEITAPGSSDSSGLKDTKTIGNPSAIYLLSQKILHFSMAYTPPCTSSLLDRIYSPPIDESSRFVPISADFDDAYVRRPAIYFQDDYVTSPATYIHDTYVPSPALYAQDKYVTSPATHIQDKYVTSPVLYVQDKYVTSPAIYVPDKYVTSRDVHSQDEYGTGGVAYLQGPTPLIKDKFYVQKQYVKIPATYAQDKYVTSHAVNLQDEYGNGGFGYFENPTPSLQDKWYVPHPTTNFQKQYGTCPPTYAQDKYVTNSGLHFQNDYDAGGVAYLQDGYGTHPFVFPQDKYFSGSAVNSIKHPYPWNNSGRRVLQHPLIPSYSIHQPYRPCYSSSGAPRFVTYLRYLMSAGKLNYHVDDVAKPKMTQKSDIAVTPTVVQQTDNVDIHKPNQPQRKHIYIGNRNLGRLYVL